MKTPPEHRQIREELYMAARTAVYVSTQKAKTPAVARVFFIFHVTGKNLRLLAGELSAHF